MSENDPSRVAPFCVTIVGATAGEAAVLESALRRIAGEPRFETRQVARVASASVTMEVVHAIVFTPTSLVRADASDVEAVRAATEPGTCRVYLFAPAGARSGADRGPIDDFVQDTPSPDASTVAREVGAFFREADQLNRRSAVLASRDRACLQAFEVLKLLWPCSYLVAAMHIVSAIAVLAGSEPWPSFLTYPYVVPFATLFGAFFVVNAIIVVVRNAVFAVRFMAGLGAGFVSRAGVWVLAAVATSVSVAEIDGSPVRILICTVLAACAYGFYMYARRIRAECTSLSDMQLAMVDDARRTDVLITIGSSPFTPVAFPLIPSRSNSLFVSYMHESEWSSTVAALLQDGAGEHGLEVFVDRSSIPSGSRWRQFLLRALSECGAFIAVLDGDAEATGWVLAESAYAALLRKSIGKPRILLVVKSTAGLERLRHGPFGVLYRDLFELSPDDCLGAAILVAREGEVSADTILQAMQRVRRMGLLS